MIAIVDCGMGNLHSMEAGLRRAGAAVRLVDTAADIETADKIVFPGDGHFAACIKAIEARGLRDALVRAAATKPFLGVCIGMQVLYESSDEAPGAVGLGILRGRIRRLPSGAGKIPHIGWNTLQQTRPHPILRGVEEAARFYFVHSYYAAPDEETIAQTEYGVPVAALSARDMMIAAQFHPEKSGRVGAQLLKYFVAS